MEALWEMFTEQRALVSRALIEFQGSSDFEHLIMHSTVEIVITHHVGSDPNPMH